MHDSTEDFGDGTFGICAWDNDTTKFDNFSFTRLDQINPVVPRWSATAKATLDNNALKVESAEWGGEAKLDMAGDDDYLAQADIKLNSGADGQLMFRYTNPDNYYAVRLDSGGAVKLVKVVRGKESTVATSTYATATSVPVKVSASGTSIKAWVDGTLKIDTTDSDLATGTVALAGEKAIFDTACAQCGSMQEAGYDTNSDNAIDSYIVDEAFDSTSVTVTHDNAGNLTYDGTYRYTYDPWNRLVKTTLNAAGDQGGSQQDITIQTAKYDGLGRRVQKAVTNSGDLDGTVRYYYNKNQIIETLDGAGKLINQVYHGRNTLMRSLPCGQSSAGPTCIKTRTGT